MGKPEKDTTDHALQALQHLGIGGREAHFASAHEQGCCYLCHVPYRHAVAACPCPHWFLMPCSLEGRIEPIFETYRLADVLHYLLLRLRAGGVWRPFGELNAIRTASTVGLRLRLNTRLWSFETADGTEAEPATVVVRCPRRSKPDLVATVAAQASDIKVLKTLAGLAPTCPS